MGKKYYIQTDELYPHCILMPVKKSESNVQFAYPVDEDDLPEGFIKKYNKVFAEWSELHSVLERIVDKVEYGEEA